VNLLTSVTPTDKQQQITLPELASNIDIRAVGDKKIPSINLTKLTINKKFSDTNWRRKLFSLIS